MVEYFLCLKDLLFSDISILLYIILIRFHQKFVVFLFSNGMYISLGISLVFYVCIVVSREQFLAHFLTQPYYSIDVIRLSYHVCNFITN